MLLAPPVAEWSSFMVMTGSTSSIVDSVPLKLEIGTDDYSYHQEDKKVRPVPVFRPHAIIDQYVPFVALRIVLRKHAELQKAYSDARSACASISSVLSSILD